MRENSYDVVIVGGGAAGMTAGLYACRAGLKTVLLESMMTGGQVINAERIENYPGFPDGISGAEFGPLLQDQATRDGLVVELSEVTGLQCQDHLWTVETYGGERVGRVVIIAGGSTLKKLGIPGERRSCTERAYPTARHATEPSSLTKWSALWAAATRRWTRP